MDVRSWARTLALGAAALVFGGFLRAGAAQAQTPLLLNESLETTAGALNPPTTQDGLMTVTPCRRCELKVLRSTSRTVYMLRDVPVSLATFRQAISTNSSIFVKVLYVTNNNELVTVTANVDASTARSR